MWSMPLYPPLWMGSSMWSMTLYPPHTRAVISTPKQARRVVKPVPYRYDQDVYMHACIPTCHATWSFRGPAMTNRTCSQNALYPFRQSYSTPTPTRRHKRYYSSKARLQRHIYALRLYPT